VAVLLDGLAALEGESPARRTRRMDRPIAQLAVGREQDERARDVGGAERRLGRSRVACRQDAERQQHAGTGGTSSITLHRYSSSVGGRSSTPADPPKRSGTATSPGGTAHSPPSTRMLTW